MFTLPLRLKGETYEKNIQENVIVASEHYDADIIAAVDIGIGKNDDDCV